MNKIYFLTFADSSLKPSLKRIKKQAQEMAIFDEIYVYTENDLPNNIYNDVKTIIEKTGKTRGYGYWRWKPAIVNIIISKMSYGDILFYSDAGTHLNVKGRKKLLEYIEITKANDIFVTKLNNDFPDTKWTKKDTLKLFEDKISPEKLSQDGQIQGGTIILMKNDYTISIMEQWNQLMSIDNMHYYDDSPSIEPNYPDFIENRHDQSILSLILKANHYYAIDTNHTYAIDEIKWLKLENDGEPILQKRDKINKRDNINKKVTIFFIFLRNSIKYPRYFLGYIKQNIFKIKKNV